MYFWVFIAPSWWLSFFVMHSCYHNEKCVDLSIFEMLACIHTFRKVFLFSKDQYLEVRKFYDIQIAICCWKCGIRQFQHDYLVIIYFNKTGLRTLTQFCREAGHRHMKTHQLKLYIYESYNFIFDYINTLFRFDFEFWR